MYIAHMTRERGPRSHEGPATHLKRQGLGVTSLYRKEPRMRTDRRLLWRPAKRLVTLVWLRPCFSYSIDGLKRK